MLWLLAIATQQIIDPSRGNHACMKQLRAGRASCVRKLFPQATATCMCCIAAPAHEPTAHAKLPQAQQANGGKRAAAQGRQSEMVMPAPCTHQLLLHLGGGGLAVLIEQVIHLLEGWRQVAAGGGAWGAGPRGGYVGAWPAPGPSPSWYADRRHALLQPLPLGTSEEGAC